MGLLAVVAGGFAAGFAVAASPGVVNLVGLRWGLQRGAGATVFVGLGAATADASYIALALVGVLPLLAAADWLSTVLLSVGGIALILLGLVSVRSGAALTENAIRSPVRGVAEGRGPYLVGLTMTLANPATIVAWLAIAGGLLASAEVGDGASGSWLGGGLTLAAVFSGSAVWFVILALLVAALRSRMGVRQLRAVAIAAGLLLVVLGVLLIVRAGADVVG